MGPPAGNWPTSSRSVPVRGNEQYLFREIDLRPRWFQIDDDVFAGPDDRSSTASPVRNRGLQHPAAHR